jgi:hypothetical protein
MILTASIIVMLLVAMGFASGILNTKMAQNEYHANQEFLSTTGQQIDDIAWIVGRTQTVSYSSRFGQMSFQPNLVSYKIEINTGSNWITLGTFETGVILFNMPTNAYSMGDSYFERIPNSADGSFLQRGASAPINQVFCIQKDAMDGGGYLRIVVVPTLRMLDSANYSKFYLPKLENGTSPYLSQSVTLSGNGIERFIKSGVDQVRISVSFPKAALGYDSDFFHFSQLSEIVTLPQDSVVELYVGGVTVKIGGA